MASVSIREVVFVHWFLYCIEYHDEILQNVDGLWPRTITLAIQPNYHTVHLGFSKLRGKLDVKYVPTYIYTKYTLKKKKKKDQQRNHQMMIMGCFCVVFFLLIFYIKGYVVGIQLNCMDKSMQFKWLPTTYAFIKQ